VPIAFPFTCECEEIQVPLHDDTPCKATKVGASFLSTVTCCIAVHEMTNVNLNALSGCIGGGQVWTAARVDACVAMEAICDCERAPFACFNETLQDVLATDPTCQV